MAQRVPVDGTLSLTQRQAYDLAAARLIEAAVAAVMSLRDGAPWKPGDTEMSMANRLEAIRLWVQIVTGSYLDPTGTVKEVDAETRSANLKRFGIDYHGNWYHPP